MLLIKLNLIECMFIKHLILKWNAHGDEVRDS